MEIIDSETCNIDGQKMVYFMHPKTLAERMSKTLSNVGSKKFFSIKKEGREAVPEYFFTLGLKKDSKKDWYLMQPESDPPFFR